MKRKQNDTTDDGAEGHLMEPRRELFSRARTSSMAEMEQMTSEREGLVLLEVSHTPTYLLSQV